MHTITGVTGQVGSAVANELLAVVPLPGRPFRAENVLCRPVTPGFYAPSRASTSRARGSRCGPFIVAAVMVEHED